MRKVTDQPDPRTAEQFYRDFERDFSGGFNAGDVVYIEGELRIPYYVMGFENEGFEMYAHLEAVGPQLTVPLKRKVAVSELQTSKDVVLSPTRHIMSRVYVTLPNISFEVRGIPDECLSYERLAS